MGRVGRARERGEAKGFIQVLLDREMQKILGATFSGVEPDEVIRRIIDVMNARMAYTTISGAVHTQPNVSGRSPRRSANCECCGIGTAGRAHCRRASDRSASTPASARFRGESRT